MATMNQVIGEAMLVIARNLNNGGSPVAAADTTSPTPTPTPTATPAASGGGSTQSPLLFFVALGFGVVFTNLWIIVGVKYCFRYNARNRALARGEDGEPIDLTTMPRPHRRRREKKLMTMDEVNERFPLMKYKNWIASRESQGLPTAGGVTAPPSRAVSLREVDGVLPPSSPTDTKDSEERPTTTASATPEVEAGKRSSAEVTNSIEARKSTEEAAKIPVAIEGHQQLPTLQEVNTNVTIDPKDSSRTSEGEDSDDEEDHIHTALGPDVLDHPGDSCAICIDVLENDDDIRGLTCGHAFHASCLDPWLTSRRACCPLCKADYFVPKPRPEGEAAEPERPRRSGRMNVNMPQPPRNAWTGIRGGHRMMLPGRFMANPMYPNDGYGYAHAGDRVGSRRARRDAAAAASLQATDGPGRSFFSMPRFRLPSTRAQDQRTAAAAAASVEAPTPGQLEAGVR